MKRSDIKRLGLRHVVPFLFLFGSGCAQVEVNSPRPRLQSPEALGTPGFGGRLGIGSSHELKATESGGTRPPDLEHPDIRGAVDIFPAFFYSVVGKIDLGAEVNILGRGIGAIGKVQIWGDGFTTAKSGNFALAAFGRLGTTGGSNSGDQKDTFGDGGYNWKGSLRNNYAEAGGSLGYRFTDTIGLFAGGARAWYSAKVNIDQDATDGGSDPGGSYSKEYSGDGTSVGAGLNLQLRKINVNFVTEWVTIEYGGAHDFDDWMGHVDMAAPF